MEPPQPLHIPREKSAGAIVTETLQIKTFDPRTIDSETIATG
jgi:hypothetical protein